MWEDYNKERVANIRSQVEITSVLEHYGIRILTTEREFQYPCPLHGNGQDNSPSARMYPESQSTYCFACHKARDVVGWVMDAEALPFGKALGWIERTFGVRNVPKPTFDAKDENQRKQLDVILDTPKKEETLLDIIVRMDAIASRALRNRPKHVTWEQATKVFFIMDNVRFDLQHDNISEDKAKKILGKVYQAIEKWADA